MYFVIVGIAVVLLIICVTIFILLVKQERPRRHTANTEKLIETTRFKRPFNAFFSSTSHMVASIMQHLTISKPTDEQVTRRRYPNEYD